MAGAPRPVSTDAVELTVHNEGPSDVEVQAVVHGDEVVVHTLSLDSRDTATLSAAPGAAVEVHSPSGTATTLADSGSFFVVRDGRVLVSSP